jgi:hypothetical protein
VSTRGGGTFEHSCDVGSVSPRRPLIRAPERDADSGNHRRERDGPQVGVVDLAPVDDLAARLGGGVGTHRTLARICSRFPRRTERRVGTYVRRTSIPFLVPRSSRSAVKPLRGELPRPSLHRAGLVETRQDGGPQQPNRQCALQEGLAGQHDLVPCSHLVQPGRTVRGSGNLREIFAGVARIPRSPSRRRRDRTAASTRSRRRSRPHAHLATERFDFGRPRARRSRGRLASSLSRRPRAAKN